MNRWEVDELLERAVKCLEDMDVENDYPYYGEAVTDEIVRIIKDYHKLMEG